MDDIEVPGPSKGYQKQIKTDAQKAQPKPKANVNVDYSSPTAKKWPLLLEALEKGDLDAVKQLIEEGINVNLLREGVTPLMIASSKGRTEIAETILQAGVNINEKSDDGWTALHKAAYDQQETAIVELLMQSGIDVEAKDKAGKTALNLAQEKGHRDIVRVIKKHQAQLVTDAQEWEDFLNSSEGKPYKQQKLYELLTLYSKFLWLPPLALGGVGFLLGYLLGAPLLSALIGLAAGLVADFAFYYYETSLRKYLDQIGPLPELDIYTLRQKRKAGEPILGEKKGEPLPGGEPSAVSSLESALPDISPAPVGDEPDSTMVLETSDEEKPTFEVTGNRTLVTIIIIGLILLIISAIAFMYRTPLTRLYYTKTLEHRGIPFTEQAFLGEVANNNEEAVDLFVKAGINENAANDKGQTALLVASDKGHLRLIEKLARLNPNALNHVDKAGNTALMTAVRQGREQAAKILLENGADVNFAVKSGEGAATALQAAVDAPDFKEEHLKTVQYLIQKGADVKARNAQGRVPLMFAVEQGRTEAAKELIEHGADVNAADEKGNFPLLIAACKGYPFLVSLLIEKGANSTMALPDGNTPLMCAVRQGNADIVNMLLEKGANINAKNSTGSTALTEATSGGNVDLVKILLGRGADPATGSLPASFVALPGKTITVTAKKNKAADILRRIAKTASQDGYAIRADGSTQKTTISAKASWNSVLIDFAKKNRLLLVVKDKEIFVVPYGK